MYGLKKLHIDKTNIMIDLVSYKIPEELRKKEKYLNN
jgi:hypothetical protein